MPLKRSKCFTDFMSFIQKIKNLKEKEGKNKGVTSGWKFNHLFSAGRKEILLNYLYVKYTF